MIAKLAIVFVGIIVAGVFLNLYYAVFAFFTVLLLGINSQLVFTVQYWICCAAGVATSVVLVRKIWPETVDQTD